MELATNQITYTACTLKDWEVPVQSISYKEH